MKTRKLKKLFKLSLESRLQDFGYDKKSSKVESSKTIKLVKDYAQYKNYTLNQSFQALGLGIIINKY